MKHRPTRAVLGATALIALLTAPAPVPAQDTSHLPPPPRYNGVKDAPEAPLPCRPSAAGDTAARLQCVEEQLARMQRQLDRIEQADEHLAHLLDRLAEADRNR